MLKGNVVILKEDGIYPNPLTLWSSPHSPHLPRGRHQIRCNAVHSAEGLCVHWYAHWAAEEHCLWPFSRALVIYFTFTPIKQRHLLNFSWCCHRISFKSTVCSRLKRLAKEEALWLAHTTALACVGFLGKNYAFTGQLRYIWLFCQLKNSLNSVPATIRYGCLKFPLNEMLGTFIPQWYVPWKGSWKYRIG